jgi:hypothetical protein
MFGDGSIRLVYLAANRQKGMQTYFIIQAMRLIDLVTTALKRATLATLFIHIKLLGCGSFAAK